MAKLTRRQKARLEPAELENEENFRATRAHRKSEAAKRATAEARKERRRQYYARDADKIREKNRIHIAKKRAIAKTKRSSSKPSRAETRQAPELTADELAASETLAQMQADRAAQGLCLHDTPRNSPTSRAREEMAIDKEISALLEKGERLCPSDSDDEEGTGDLGETANLPDRNRNSLRARQRRRLLLVQSMGPKYSARRTPSPDPPSPSPKKRLPSLYDKLFDTRQKAAEREDGQADR
ncbi:hypothetical protein R3P38DRAFT_3214502 [Favolaschia claudopus]|uniref:Uncharacterized protein n=1 Tax=Favolaschia claudopus TaxID=2862362 RepID=A0AAW0AC69_9AGAR